jgi:RNA polymerase sigma factor (sigma-70 family)
LLALDEALAELERVDQRLARIVELRFFGGLSVEETAEVEGVSPRTVKRDWRKARAFLFNAMRGDAATENDGPFQE